MQNAQVVSYVGASVGTALKATVPHLQQHGYDPKQFMAMVMESLQDLGMGLQPKTAVSAGVSVSHTASLSTPLVGIGNSGADIAR